MCSDTLSIVRPVFWETVYEQLEIFLIYSNKFSTLVSFLLSATHDVKEWRARSTQLTSELSSANCLDLDLMNHSSCSLNRILQAGNNGHTFQT